jgi:hypothetical protein
MAQRTYKDIEAEANKRFGKGASREKFEFRRAQQEAAGLEKETKKRGGVAGAYDRNKAIVQAAVPTLAGMLIPGGAIAGAVAGGLARGLDRPGKGGIGLDLGQAARGAVTGAALGKLGSMAGKGLGIGPGATPAPLPEGVVRTPNYGARIGTEGMSPMQRMTTGVGDLAQRAVSGAQSLGGRAIDFAKANPMVTSAALGGVSDVLGQRSQQALEEQRMAQQQSQFQQQFDVSEEERKRRLAEANRLAALFMPRA